MLYLVASIIFTSYLTLSFKVIERLRIDSFPAIVFNYITCVITGSFVEGRFPIDHTTTRLPWFFWALMMGAIFISLFNLVAITTQRVGIAVTTVAYKVSLIMPFLFSIYYYREPLGFIRLAGILLALMAVIFTCYRKPDAETVSDRKFPPHVYYLLPLIVFAGSGVLDTMIKFVEADFLGPANYNSYLITAFATAASIGVVMLFLLIVTGRLRFSFKAVFAGIAIGVPNYFSIWFLLKALKAHSGNSAVIIPVNNMGIVLFSAVVAWLVFKERMTAVNWLGILLSILSIALIAFG